MKQKPPVSARRPQRTRRMPDFGPWPPVGYVGIEKMMAAVGVAALYRSHVAPWMYTWGARADEVRAVLPGDELVDPDSPQTTRAVTIDAPRRELQRCVKIARFQIRQLFEYLFLC